MSSAARETGDGTYKLGKPRKPTRGGNETGWARWGGQDSREMFLTCPPGGGSMYVCLPRVEMKTGKAELPGLLSLAWSLPTESGYNFVHEPPRIFWGF